MQNFNKIDIVPSSLFQVNQEKQDQNRQKTKNKRVGPNGKLLFAKNRKQYYWNDFQQKRYIIFIKESLDLLSLPVQQRKNNKINILMSKKIKTRNPAQCHTHHQKMMAKFLTIENIIENHSHLIQNQEKQIKKSIEQILQLSMKLLSPLKCLQGNQIMMEQKLLLDCRKNILFQSTSEQIDQYPIKIQEFEWTER